MNSWIKRNIKLIKESQTPEERAAKETPVFIEAYLKEMETDPDFTCKIKMETFKTSEKIMPSFS